jgi:hypothetical protein
MTMLCAALAGLLLAAAPRTPAQEADANAEWTKFRADLEAPAGGEARTKRLVEMFKEAGAPEAGVAVVPLGAALEKRFAEASERLRARLEKGGATR